MIYSLDMGAIEQNIVKQAMRAGAPIPDAIANAPKLIDGLQIFLMAFYDLDAERSQGFAPSPIPWSSIVKYSEVYGFDEEQREDLIYFIKRMDSEHLKRMREKTK